MKAATMAQFAYLFKGKSRHLQQSFAYMAASGLLTDHRFLMALGTVWTTTGFMREHCQLLVDLVLLNRHFALRLIFWFFLPMILLCTLYFLPVYFLLKLYMYFLYSCLLIFLSFSLCCQWYLELCTTPTVICSARR